MGSRFTVQRSRRRFGIASSFARLLSGVSTNRELRTAPLAFAALCLCLVGVAPAQIKATYTELPNGLKVILYPTKQAPTVSCRLFYVTGSVHERPGTTGIAHLLEHMLFKGTRKVGVAAESVAADSLLEIRIEALMRRMERSGDSARAALRARYDSLIAEQRKGLVSYELWGAFEKAGGTGLNAFTSDLMTAYIVTLPRNRVELYLWLEADRMQNAVLREFLPERDVVMEERRMRVEDSPMGRYWESLVGTFYEAHPYRFPTIGYPSDIPNLTQAEAQEHYRRYYKPNNAILVLAGDLDTAATLRDIRRYFGGIPRGDAFPPVVTQEPAPAGEKRLTVRRADAAPRLDILFHTPGFPHEDLHALDVLQGVLSGKSGRLHKKLVENLKIAVSAGAGNGAELYTSSFHVSANLDGTPDAAAVEKAVWDVLDDLAKHPVSARELQRARNQVAAEAVRKVEDLDELATELAYWEMRGGWENINAFPEAVQKVTAAQVQAAAAKYFNRDAATVGLLLPPRASGEAPRAGKAQDKKAGTR